MRSADTLEQQVVLAARSEGWKVGYGDAQRHNAALVSAAGKRLTSAYLDEIAARYDRAQDEILPPDHPGTTRAAQLAETDPGTRMRRRSVLHRTGPQLLSAVQDRLGATSLDAFTAFTVGTAHSWMPPATFAAPRHYADEETPAVLARVVATLGRGLRNRPGVLALTDVAPIVNGLPDPAAAWEAAVATLISRPDLFPPITSVADRRIASAAGDAVVAVPDAVWALLGHATPPDAGAGSWHRGERHLPATPQPALVGTGLLGTDLVEEPVPLTPVASFADAAGVAETLRQLGEAADTRITTAEYLYGVLTEVAAADVVRKGPYAARLRSWHRRARLDRAVDELRRARAALDEPAVLTPGGSHPRVGELLAAMHRVSSLSEAAGQQVRRAVEDEAVRAYVREQTAERREELNGYLDGVTMVIDAFAPALLPTGLPAVPAAVAAGVKAASYAALEAFLAWQTTAFEARDSSTAALYAHDADPLLVAKAAVQRQKDGFALLMAAAGIGGAYVPGWSIISSAITKVFEGYVEHSLALAEQEAARPDPDVPAWQRAARGAWTGLREEVQAKLGDPGFAQTVYEQARGEGELLDGIAPAVDVVVAGMLGALLQIMPPTPSTPVSGDTLRDMILKVSGHRPDAAAAQRPLPHRELGLEPAPLGLPEADGFGRRVVRYRAAESGPGHWRVAIEYHGVSVWGDLREDRTFTPVRADLPPYTSRRWLNRTINADGYVEHVAGEQSRTVRGTWHRPFGPADATVLFADEHGRLEWAQSVAPTGGLDSDEHNIHHEFDGSHASWLRPFTWDPPAVLLVDFAEHAATPTADPWLLHLFADHAARLLASGERLTIHAEGGRNPSLGVRSLFGPAQDTPLLRADAAGKLVTDRLAALEATAPLVTSSRGESLTASRAPAVDAGTDLARQHRQVRLWIATVAGTPPGSPLPSPRAVRATTVLDEPDGLLAGLAAITRQAFAVPGIPVPAALRLVAAPEAVDHALTLGAALFLAPVVRQERPDTRALREVVGDRYAFGTYLLGVLDQVRHAEFVAHDLFAAADLAVQRASLARAVEELAAHRRALTGVVGDHDPVFVALETFARRAERSGQIARRVLERAAVGAWIAQRPDAQRDRLEELVGYAQGLLGWVGGAFLPSGASFAPAAVGAGGKLAGHLALAGYEAWQSAHYLRGTSAPEALLHHDDDPLTMARTIVAEQKRGFELLLSVAGIGGAYVPGWPVIESALTKIASAYLDERLTLASVPPPDGPGDTRTPWQRAADRFWSGLRDELAAKAKDPAALETIKEHSDVLALAGIGVDLAVASGVQALLAVMPPTPAQKVTGDDLRRMILQVVGHRTVATAVADPPVQPVAAAPAGAPATVLDGHPVVGGTGTALIADLHGTRFHGDHDPATSTFTPRSVHPGDAVSPRVWLNRVVGAHHYLDRTTGERVEGTWYQPWPDRFDYLFVGRDGRVEAAQAMAPTGGMNSDEYNLHHLLTPWVRPLPWQAPQTLTVEPGTPPSYDAWTALQLAHRAATSAGPATLVEVVVQLGDGRLPGLLHALDTVTGAAATRARTSAAALIAELRTLVEAEWRRRHERLGTHPVPPLPVTFTTRAGGASTTVTTTTWTPAPRLTSALAAGAGLPAGTALVDGVLTRLGVPGHAADDLGRRSPAELAARLGARFVPAPSGALSALTPGSTTVVRTASRTLLVHRPGATGPEDPPLVMADPATLDWLPVDDTVVGVPVDPGGRLVEIGANGRVRPVAAPPLPAPSGPSADALTDPVASARREWAAELSYGGNYERERTAAGLRAIARGLGGDPARSALSAGRLVVAVPDAASLAAELGAVQDPATSKEKLRARAMPAYTHRWQDAATRVLHAPGTVVLAGPGTLAELLTGPGHEGDVILLSTGDLATLATTHPALAAALLDPPPRDPPSPGAVFAPPQSQEVGV